MYDYTFFLIFFIRSKMTENEVREHYNTKVPGVYVQDIDGKTYWVGHEIYCQELQDKLERISQMNNVFFNPHIGFHQCIDIPSQAIEQELEEFRISIEHIIMRSKLQKMFHHAYYDEDNNRWICSNPIRNQDV